MADLSFVVESSRPLNSSTHSIHILILSMSKLPSGQDVNEAFPTLHVGDKSNWGIWGILGRSSPSHLLEGMYCTKYTGFLTRKHTPDFQRYEKQGHWETLSNTYFRVTGARLRVGWPSALFSSHPTHDLDTYCYCICTWSSSEVQQYGTKHLFELTIIISENLLLINMYILIYPNRHKENSYMDIIKIKTVSHVCILVWQFRKRK